MALSGQISLNLVCRLFDQQQTKASSGLHAPVANDPERTSNLNTANMELSSRQSWEQSIDSVGSPGKDVLRRRQMAIKGTDT